MCRSARLAAGLIWLLSVTPTFGQNSRAVREHLADVKVLTCCSLSRSISQIFFSSRLLSVRFAPYAGAHASREAGTVPNLNRTLPQLSDGQHAFSSAIKPVRTRESGGFHWSSALGQSLLFLGIEHSLRLAFDPPSRTALRGRFWSDYVDSLHNLGHWGDGNPIFINYLGHPLQGSVAGFIQIQNDPGGRALQISWSRQYRNSRLKALAWSAAYSTYFEIGAPLSEAALGNLGVDKHRRTQQGVVDIVVTPTLGLALLITEDFVDRYVVTRLERGHGGNSQKLIRSFLNPTRSFSNLLRFKYPWYRDGRS